MNTKLFQGQVNNNLPQQRNGVEDIKRNESFITILSEALILCICIVTLFIYIYLAIFSRDVQLFFIPRDIWYKIY